MHNDDEGVFLLFQRIGSYGVKVFRSASRAGSPARGMDFALQHCPPYELYWHFLVN